VYLVSQAVQQSGQHSEQVGLSERTSSGQGSKGLDSTLTCGGRGVLQGSLQLVNDACNFKKNWMLASLKHACCMEFNSAFWVSFLRVQLSSAQQHSCNNQIICHPHCLLQWLNVWPWGPMQIWLA
jgi:hypothetical protein